LASFGQLRWTVSEVFDYSKDAIASEVCNSNTWNVLTFRRSTPVAIAFMKAAVVETLDHGGSFGWREIRNRRARFLDDQWRQHNNRCNRGFIFAFPL
jgi:hypothetical protein